MSEQRMRLTVHISTNGAIRDAVIQPYGEVVANLVSEPGLIVAEIPEHEFHGTLDEETLERLHNDFMVEVKPAQGTLVRAAKQSS